MPDESLFRDHLAGSVRAELARRQIGVREAAAIAYVSTSTMHRRLQDGRFTIDTLSALAAHFGMRVSDLLPTDGEILEAYSA